MKALGTWYDRANELTTDFLQPYADDRQRIEKGNLD